MNSTTTAEQLDTKADSDEAIAWYERVWCCLTWSQPLPDVVSERKDSEGSASGLGDADILQYMQWRVKTVW